MTGFDSKQQMAADKLQDKSDMLTIAYLEGRYMGRKTAQRQWVKLIRGVRVDGDTVVVSVRGGNDAARELCGELIKEIK